MIGIIVPAHNEEACVKQCVESLLIAAAHSSLQGEEVRILFVLDDCTDGTLSVLENYDVLTLVVSGKNVGRARQIGADLLVEEGARWLCFTDADTVVAPDWIACQLALNVDVVCGTVAVDDWVHYGDRMEQHFQLTYTDADGHAHVHGANLGVSATAYIKAGGFSAVCTGEDVALVQALKDSGAVIAWSAAPRVVTSARETYRAPEGFGATLERIHRLGEWVAPGPLGAFV